MTAAAPAYAGEPGGFRPGLYLGEAAVACALSIPVAVAGFYLVETSCSSYDDGGDEAYLPFLVIGNSLAFAYPFAATLGTMGVGEHAGSESTNQGTAYLLSSLASVGAAAAAGFGGLLIFDDDDRHYRFWLGVSCGIIPNAFLNAYVYNVVKKPADDASSSRFSVAPYVAVSRAGRSEATPVYGLTLSF